MRRAPTLTFTRARAAVTASFASHAVVAGTLGPWIPPLKQRTALNDGGLGLALTGYAIGLVAGTRIAGPALKAAGPRAVVRAGVPGLAFGLALLPLASGLGSFAAILVVIGLASGVLDVAMNTEAVVVEDRYERRVMSSLHGSWSVAAHGQLRRIGRGPLAVGLTSQYAGLRAAFLIPTGMCVAAAVAAGATRRPSASTA